MGLGWDEIYVVHALCTGGSSTVETGESAILGRVVLVCGVGLVLAATVDRTEWKTNFVPTFISKRATRTSATSKLFIISK